MCQEGAVGEIGYKRKIKESNFTYPVLMFKWKQLLALFQLGGYCDCSLDQQHLRFVICIRKFLSYILLNETRGSS